MVNARLGPYRAANAMLVREPYSLGLGQAQAEAAVAPTPGFGYTSSGKYPAPTQVPLLDVSGSGGGGAGATASGSGSVSVSPPTGAPPITSKIGLWFHDHWKIALPVAVVLVIMILVIPAGRRY